MTLDYNHDLKERARELRKNQTDAERKLWRHLRNRQLENTRWYRQKPLGNFIVDFYCPGKKLVVELDGSQHFTNQKKYDEKRDAYLTSQGLKVLRFSNRDALTNIEGVLIMIRKEIV